jgi:hypothetical protein
MAYSIELPDGTLVEDIPDGVTPEQAKAKILKWRPELGSKERTWGEALTDIPASITGGVGKVLQIPGQISGLVTGDFTEDGLYGVGKRIEKHIEENVKSKGLKAREAARDAAVREAEKKGQWQAFKTAFGESVTDPALLTSFIAEQIPMAIPGGLVGRGVATGAKVLGAGTKAAIGAGTAGAIGTGAIMQGADVGADTYDTIYKALIEKGLSKEEAAAETINKARAAGLSGAAISVLANRFLPGGRALERILVGEKQNKGRILTGLATGAKEIPSENVEEVGGQIAKNIAARSAGLDTDLLSGVGQTAAMATIGAAGTGTTLGALGGGQRAPAFTEGKFPTDINKGSVLDELSKEFLNAGQTLDEAGGDGTRVAGKPSAGVSTGESTETESDRVVPAGPDADESIRREAERTNSLAEFARQRKDLQDEYQVLASNPRPTEVDTRQMRLIQRDLAEIVDANAEIIGNPELIDQLKNPMFDGTREISALAGETAQRRAMQGDMFGEFKLAYIMARNALAMAGGDPVAAAELIRRSKERYQSNLAAGKYDDNWAISESNRLGIPAGQAIKDRETLAEQHVARMAHQADQAIDFIERAPLRRRGMQEDMFAGERRQRDPFAKDVGGTSLVELEQSIKDKITYISKELDRNKNDYTELQNRIRPVEPKAKTDLKNLIDARERELIAAKQELADVQTKIASGETTTGAGWVAGQPPAKPKPPRKRPESITGAPVQTSMFEQEEETEADKLLSAISTKQKPTATPAADLDFFGEDTDVDTAQEAAKPEAPAQDQKGQPILAPIVSVEHVSKTEEGAQIKDFFDAVQSAGKTPTEQERHGNSKNVAAKTLLEYDIAAPGEAGGVGIKSMLKYLAARVGGKDALRNLTNALKLASPDEQSRLFKEADLPDLTSRKGIEQFSDEIREHVSQLSGKETGVKTPTSPVYAERVQTGATVTTVHGKTPEGKPRRPSQGTRPNEYVIADSKIRAAIRALRQAFDRSEKLTPNQQAAINYLNNINRKSFGEALAALAFDLAYFEVDPKYYNANSVFFGEGGKYAEQFRDWIKENLSPNTLEVLNEMVEEHKQTAAANEQYSKAIAQYHEALDKYNAQLAKERKKQKSISKEASKIKHISEAVDETEATEKTETPDIEVSTKNLPTIQMLTEVHPDIVRKLNEGDLNGALEIIAQQSKTNPYYAALAQRILDTGINAKVRMVDANKMESLSDDPKVEESLKARLATVSNIVQASYPADVAKVIQANLNSNKLPDVIAALYELDATIGTTSAIESEKQAIESLKELINTQYSWAGMYDPRTNSVVLRQGAGRMTNHLLLHESLHAAAAHLIDNADKLSGIQKEGYNRLKELYAYSKAQLSGDGTPKIYGLQDIHEFVSEALTNPQFQAQLRGLRYKAAPYSLYNRFTDAIRRLFKIKPGRESNVLNEAIFAADAMMAGTMNLEGLTPTTGPKAMATAALPAPKRAKPRNFVPTGMPNQPSALNRFMKAPTWPGKGSQLLRMYRSMKASARPSLLGTLTLRQLDDLVGGRVPQIGNFIRVTDQLLANKNRIVNRAGQIQIKWERLQSADLAMSIHLGKVMHAATILEVDPDKPTAAQRAANPQLMRDWNKLSPEAKKIYREVRDFFARMHTEYKRTMVRRILMLGQYGVSQNAILNIRNQFEQGLMKGPYFPLMRHGRFWYQVGTGTSREYYMFESADARDTHIQERLARSPHLTGTIDTGNDYAKQMDAQARQAGFVKDIFEAVDNANFANLSPTAADARKQELKDNFYQSYLHNQPDRSFRNQFIHRQNVEGFSQDALRNFASMSNNLANQLSRLKYSPELFSQLDAAREQIKRRTTPGAPYSEKLTAENDELRDLVKEVELRRSAMLSPTDDNAWVSWFSNVGFIYYLTSVASAITNVLGGAMIGIPTLVGQQVRANPNMGYTKAVANVMSQVAKTVSDIFRTGFDVETGGRVRDFRLLTPSFTRSKTLSKIEREAYNKFVSDGLIDITATYDISGLASKPTEKYSGIPNKAMQVVAFLFHHAERFNREVVAMSSFRAAMQKRANYADQRLAFQESIAEAKDATNRSMFDYSSANKPRYMQHPVARVLLQFKQFPQQMTFFLARNAYNSIVRGNLTKAEQREARARFIGTMGTASILSGVTGMWGFSTVAAIVEAVFNWDKDPDDEDRMDFELEFMNWLVGTFGENMGMVLGRGVGSVAGVDLHSRLKLDGMWFQDGRDNLDAQAALTERIVQSLGPIPGIGVQAARAMDAYGQGHTARAIEQISPAFVRQPLIAYRYGKEGATTKAGEPIIEDFTPFELAMQSMGIRTSKLAELQFRNMRLKSKEQTILKKKEALMNTFGLAFMTNDDDLLDKTLDEMAKYGDKHPTLFIEIDSIIKSLETRMQRSAETEDGLYIDPKLRHILSDHDYTKSLK